LKTKPTIDRSVLHPDSSKAVAMNPDGAWLSYSQIPVRDEERWLKQSPDNASFRIPASRAPAWTGDWRESLIVFEDDAGS
jgi:hypothetical protein